MLKHCVFCNLKSDVSFDEIKKIIDGFGRLIGVIDGMIDFCHGENLDFENKSKIYQYGFIISFKDREAHQAYESHPLHKELGEKLVNKCKQGEKGIMVFDLQA